MYVSIQYTNSVVWGFFVFLCFFLFLINLFFNFYFIFGCVGSSLLHAGFLQLQGAGATLRCSVRASHCGGFSCCGARPLDTQASVVVACGLQQLWLSDSRARAQQLWRTGLVAPQHVGSSQTRARNCVLCIGRWILNHCTTREAQQFVFCSFLFLFPHESNQHSLSYRPS